MIYIDIEVGGYYLCQMRYPYPVCHIMKDGVMEPLIDRNQIRNFVIRQRPSLARKKFIAEVTKQRIINE